MIGQQDGKLGNQVQHAVTDFDLRPDDTFLLHTVDFQFPFRANGIRSIGSEVDVFDDLTRENCFRKFF